MTNFMKSMVVVLMVLSVFPAASQQVMPLYEGPIPNAIQGPDPQTANEDSSVLFKVSRPTLTIYRPDPALANGTAVIVCPGGGYHALVIGREGYEMAQTLASKGVTAFVLKYRLPSDATMKDKSIGPLQDAQQAIYRVRKEAAKWHVDPHKIGIMGFSAGGHLAATAGTHFQRPVIKPGDISLRPDFMVLVYPVISMENGITHGGSRENLLGENPSTEKKRLFSNELQVDSLTPPAFLVVAADDHVVPLSNSLLFFNALRKHHRPVALHVYQEGDHGFLQNPPRKLWMKDLYLWMQTNDWLQQGR